MESERSSTTSENYKGGGEEDEVLKREISSHPLYELLVEEHMKCLKVGEISNLERVGQKKDKKQGTKKPNKGTFSESELDLFMEAYCMALGNLKEAMEEPQLKSMAFINNMHSQLRELTDGASLPSPPETATPSTSSSYCNIQTDPRL